MNKLLLLSVVALAASSFYFFKDQGEVKAVQPHASTQGSIKVFNLAEDMADYSHRSESSRARDQYRHPFATLDFFGVKSTSKVVEISPGGGWYTEILAPKLKSSGQLIAAHYPKDKSVKEYQLKSRVDFEDKLKLDLDVYGEVAIIDFNINKPVPAIASDADFVLTFRNLHGLENQNSLEPALVWFHSMLKKGGKLGIVQHEAPEGSDVSSVSKLGYLPKQYVIEQVTKAGFQLLAESSINENAKDIIVQEGIETGVWSLPPSLRVDANIDKYKAIGESNRMTLLFEKL